MLEFAMSSKGDFCCWCCFVKAAFFSHNTLNMLINLNLLISWIVNLFCFLAEGENSTQRVNVFAENLYSEKHIFTPLWQLTCAFLSLFSDPALHHFNRATPTERRWQRAKCSPNTAVAQRASAGSILRYPLWCRACICWLVKQRASIFKDSQTNRCWATAFWQSTSFF